MLNIKSKKELDNLNLSGDVELRFKNLVKFGEFFNDKIYFKVMEKIDSITEKDDIVIKTKFGTATLYQLSTGCKALLLTLYYINKDVYTCIDECGDNVLKLLVYLSKKYDLNVYTTKVIPFEGDNLEIKFNNKFFSDGFDLYKEMMVVNGND